MGVDNSFSRSLELTPAEVGSMLLGHVVKKTVNGVALDLKCRADTARQPQSVSKHQTRRSPAMPPPPADWTTHFPDLRSAPAKSTPPTTHPKSIKTDATSVEVRKPSTVQQSRDQGEQLTPQPPLLRLPAEIRNLIYNFVYEGEIIQLTKPFVRDGIRDVIFPNEANSKMLYSHHTGLLGTCKQIRSEASWVFYHQNVFVIGADLTLWLTKLPMRAQSALREVRWKDHKPTYLDTRGRFEDLLREYEHWKRLDIKIRVGTVKLRLKQRGLLGSQDFLVGPQGEEVWSSTFVA